MQVAGGPRDVEGSQAPEDEEGVLVDEERVVPALDDEVTVERTETLVKPLGYLWTVTVKMLETLEIALWGTILSVLLSVPLAVVGSGIRLTPSASR